MKKNDVSRKGDGENSDGQRGTKAERERGKAYLLIWMLWYCFCIPLCEQRQIVRRKEERSREKRERRGYRLLEICIFVGHTSSAR